MYLQMHLKMARLSMQSKDWLKYLRVIRMPSSAKRMIWLPEKHIHNIMDAVPVKNGSDTELCHLYDIAIQHYRALKAANNYSFDTVLLQQKLDDKTQLKWVEYSNDSKRVPWCTVFFKFLDLQVRHLESTCVSLISGINRCQDPITRYLWNNPLWHLLMIHA